MRGACPDLPRVRVGALGEPGRSRLIGRDSEVVVICLV